MTDLTTNPQASTDRIATIPNALSALRLASVPIFLWLFIDRHGNLAVGIFAAAAWTDFFDGYLARKTGSVSELGKLLDPMSDRVFIVALVVALVSRSQLAWGLAVAIVGRDLLLLAAYGILRGRGLPKIAVNFVGKSATAALLFGLMWLAWGETTFPAYSEGHAIGLPFVVMGAILYWTAAALYAREATRWMRVNPRGASG
ncbi:MAG: CDP-alcohol phosphatidyltransferase family protein [Actinomycetota bacterium]|nr:CDP-alcohol phosphatidyltransferase family protein [Actinomycetota bacterium]